ncbi:hypothetical protein SAMN04487969_107126, partial [Paenibacillus algorifonticola]
GTDNGNSGTDNGNSGTDNGNNETDNSNSGTDNGNNELDDAPMTGDNSVPPIFYMALALMSLMTIGFCLLGNKKKKYIQ